MKDFFLSQFTNPDSSVYNCYGSGFVPAKLGSWVDNQFTPRSYSEVQETSLGLMPKEIDDLIWDAVAEADDVILTMMGVY